MRGELKYILPAILMLAVAGCKPATTSGSGTGTGTGTGTTTTTPTSPTGPTAVTANANGFAVGPSSASNNVENSAEAIPVAAVGVVVTPNFYTRNGVHLGVDEGPVDWVQVTVQGTLLDGTSFPAAYELRDHDGLGNEYWAINEETDSFLEKALPSTANVDVWRYVTTDKRGAGGPWVVYFANGTKTDVANLPGGTATYTGGFFGESTQGGNGSHAGEWWTTADMSFNMNFAASTWTGNMTNMQHINKEDTNIIVNAGNWNQVPFDSTNPPAAPTAADHPSLPLTGDMQGIIEDNDFHGILRITNQGNPGYVIDKSAVVGSVYGPNGEDVAGSIGFSGTKPSGSNRADLLLRGGFRATR
ncbi:MAG: hypothetical protein AAGF86_11140 [Pseudomonadota bacterium]